MANTPKTVGNLKFSRFLADHKISEEKAASELGVRGPTINGWKHNKRPAAHFRESIEIWTNGEVLRHDWETDFERRKREQVSPFALLGAE